MLNCRKPAPVAGRHLHRIHEVLDIIQRDAIFRIAEDDVCLSQAGTRECQGEAAFPARR